MSTPNSFKPLNVLPQRFHQTNRILPSLHQVKSSPPSSSSFTPMPKPSSSSINIPSKPTATASRVVVLPPSATSSSTPSNQYPKSAPTSKASAPPSPSPSPSPASSPLPCNQTSQPIPKIHFKALSAPQKPATPSSSGPPTSHPSSVVQAATGASSPPPAPSVKPGPNSSNTASTAPNAHPQPRPVKRSRSSAKTDIHAPDYGYEIVYRIHDAPAATQIPPDQLPLVPDLTRDIRMRKYATAVDSRNFLTVYEYSLNNQWIIWDYYTGYVHLTGLWKALGHSKADIVKLLETSPDLEPVIRRVRGGFLKIQGTWVPFEIARTLAARTCFHIRYALVPLFGPDFPDSCLKPHEPGFGQLQMRLADPSSRKRRRVKKKDEKAADNASATKPSSTAPSTIQNLVAASRMAAAQYLPSPPHGASVSSSNGPDEYDQKGRVAGYGYAASADINKNTNGFLDHRQVESSFSHNTSGGGINVTRPSGTIPTLSAPSSATTETAQLTLNNKRLLSPSPSSHGAQTKRSTDSTTLCHSSSPRLSGNQQALAASTTRDPRAPAPLLPGTAEGGCNGGYVVMAVGGGNGADDEKGNVSCISSGDVTSCAFRGQERLPHEVSVQAQQQQEASAGHQNQQHVRLSSFTGLVIAKADGGNNSKNNFDGVGERLPSNIAPPLERGFDRNTYGSSSAGTYNKSPHELQRMGGSGSFSSSTSNGDNDEIIKGDGGNAAVSQVTKPGSGSGAETGRGRAPQYQQQQQQQQQQLPPLGSGRILPGGPLAQPQMVKTDGLADSFSSLTPSSLTHPSPPSFEPHHHRANGDTLTPTHLYEDVTHPPHPHHRYAHSANAANGPRPTQASIDGITDHSDFSTTRNSYSPPPSYGTGLATDHRLPRDSHHPSLSPPSPHKPTDAGAAASVLEKGARYTLPPLHPHRTDLPRPELHHHQQPLSISLQEPITPPPPLPAKLALGGPREEKLLATSPSELVQVLQATRSLQQMSAGAAARRWSVSSSASLLGGNFECGGRRFAWDGCDKLLVKDEDAVVEDQSDSLQHKAKKQKQEPRRGAMDINSLLS